MPSLGPLELDEAQFRAASGQGNALVIAGPGAGKTRTLLARAIFLMEEGVPPEDIFLLTFTVKTASELRERLEAFGVQGVRVDTFHGLAYEICRLKGLSPRLLDTEVQEEIFKEILRRRGHPLRGARKKFERLLAGAPDEEGLLSAYQEVLAREDLWDFHRLLREASSENPLGQTPCHLLVDEFQDLNKELVSFLLSFGKARFFLVGDPAQAIYGFRGAHPEVVKDFVKALEEPTVFFLPKSYRVPEKILSFANRLRETPFEVPPLEAQKPGGELLAFSYERPEQEARGVAKQVEELLGGLQMEASKRGLSPGEIAVVARVRRLLEPVREALAAAGIPLEEPSSLAEAHLAHLERVISQAKDLADLKRLLATEEALPEVSFLLSRSRDLEDFRARWHLLRLQAAVLLKRSGVALLTIHETKGLEFKAVFLVGAEEGLLPFKLLSDFSPSEEKRLAYVAVTRAEGVFRATYSRCRTLFGKRLPGKISPFFSSLPMAEISPGKKPHRPRQGSLF